jgi:hypothetical protein
VALLQRWPIFIGRYRYSPNNFASYQIAALVRPITIDDPNFVDHTATAWGLSGITRFCNASKTDAIYGGFVIGKGIGGYIYGGTEAAIVPNTTTITTLNNFGSYIGYQHVWYAKDASHNLSSDIAYGYVLGDAPTSSDNRVLNQAWANLLWNVTDKSAVGLEYQFGSRVIGSGNHGDDNRIMFVYSGQIGPKTASAQQVPSYASGSNGRTLSDFRL